MSIRPVLSFLTGKNRFNYRTAAVIVRDNHVLVCREDLDNFVMLPGGRVEFGEASDVALAREIEEELGIVCRIGDLLFSVENFFEREGETFHEIGKYYATQLPESFPFETSKPVLVTHDEGHELTFSWVQANQKSLEAINLLPQWMRARAANLPLGSVNLIMDER